MLASSFFDLVLGLDVHFELMPPPGIPTPLPNPFVGLVFDPLGLACGIALGAAISAVLGEPFKGPVLYWTAFPATNTGTEAIHVPGHFMIPPGIGWAPFPKTPKPVIRPGETPPPANPIKPENDAVVVFGSKTVAVMGSNAVRLGDIALSCSEPLRLPSSVVVAIPKGAPIIIGGPPSLDIMAAVTASLRTRFMSDSLHALVSRLNPGRFRNFLHRGVCFFTGHPVDVSSGKVMTEFIDIELPGPVPLKVERIYSSAFAARPGPLGHGWSFSLDQAIWRERGKVVLLAEDGREIEFDTFDFPRHRIEAGERVYNPIERLTLCCDSDDAWRVIEHDGVVRQFSPVPERVDGRAMIRSKRSRCGEHEISFHYGTEGHAAGQLEWVRDSGGRLLRLVHDADGRLRQLHLPKPRGEGFYQHRHYEYDEAGDLVKVGDSLGHTWSFAYLGHLLTQETDRNGLSFYFVYDGIGSDSWCVRTWGDGGIERRYAWAANGSLEKVEDISWRGGHGTLDRERRYTHDAAARLTATIRSDESVEVRAFDGAGNVHRGEGTSSRVYTDGGRLVVDGSVINTYDDDGRLVERADGEHRTQFRWDDGGLLREVLLPTGERLEFCYDAMGRRHDKRVFDTGSDEAKAAYRWQWSGHVPVHEQSDDGLMTWVYEPHGSAPVAQFSGGRAWTLATDLVGAPTEMFSASGELVWRRETDMDGNVSQTGDDVDCPLRWPGQYFDSETGLHYNRWRYYDPRTAGYLSPDPMGLFGGLRPYGYPLDPLTHADPFGLIDTWDIRFSQRTISDVFRQGPWAGKTLEEAISATRAAGCLPDGLTLNVMWYGDEWFTLNNRTLYVAQEAGLIQVQANDVGVSGSNRLEKLLKDGGPMPPGEQPEVKRSKRSCS